MSTKPVSSRKVTTKPSRTAKTTKTTATRKHAASKKSAAATRDKRYHFVAGAVLIAAALIALATGVSGHHRQSASDNLTAQQKLSAANAAGANLSIQPLSHQQVVPDTTVSVSLYETSGSTPVNAIQGALHYPADKLQLVGITTAGAFPQEAATDTSTPGLIRLARGVTVQAPPVTGDKSVATIKFKVLQQTDLASEVSVDKAESLIVRSTDNQNILGSSSTASLGLSQ
jgi:hypothetical protein